MATKEEEDRIKQARADFRAKVILESFLVSKLKIFDNVVVRSLKLNILNNQATNLKKAGRQLELILSNHYVVVGDKFEDRIAGFSLSKADKKIIKDSIEKFAKQRAIKQSNIILKTTKNDLKVISKIVRSETEDQIERSVLTSNLMKRKLDGRRGGIASFETQFMSEATKSAEVDMLQGNEPFSSDDPDPDSDADIFEKEWITMGDEVVRGAHVLANAQIVKAADFFIVMGETLQYPSDTENGASVKNTANCRCTVIYFSEN